MEITRLPIGQQAAVDSDCIRLEEQPGGTYKLTASAMCMGDEDAESVSIVGSPSFATAAQAEDAGLAWAMSVGVGRLFVSTGTLEHPLELLEFDLSSES